MEIFGGTLGVLLLFIFVLILRGEQIKEDQKNPENIGGILQEFLEESDFGYIVSCWPDSLVIEENKEVIMVEELYQSDNRFRSYVLERKELTPDKPICAFIFPGSNDVIMQVDRNLGEAGIEPYRFLVINKEIMEALRKTSEKYFQ